MFEDVGTIIPVWKIRRLDPGFIYIIEDHGKYKIGKTTRTTARFKAARTWLPDMNLVSFKPFWGISYLERLLHIGFTNYFYTGEWYDFAQDDDARDVLLEGFTAFSNDNPDMNSRDFIYWYNGEGMAEFAMEMNRKGLTLPKFQHQESSAKKSNGLLLSRDRRISIVRPGGSGR